MPKPIHFPEITPVGPPTSSPAKQPVKGPSFAKVLKESIDQVNDLQAKKTQKIEELVTGKNTTIEEVMIAVEEANVAFEFTMQVRNKLIDAYREMLRMQV